MSHLLAAMVLASCVSTFPLEPQADSAVFKTLQKQSNMLFKAGNYQQSLALIDNTDSPENAHPSI